jgi:hypothetical protein
MVIRKVCRVQWEVVEDGSRHVAFAATNALNGLLAERLCVERPKSRGRKIG